MIFKITCTRGSLSASGAITGDMTGLIEAKNIEEARKKFNSSETNQRYGRRIIRIEEEVE